VKPLQLTMQAFGPYAGIQRIDFTELEERTFFLVTGPTGSGKTTLLDAMAYALYGQTSGGGRDGEDMRSHHAGDGTQTVVVLDFQLGERIYRVERYPRQKVPRRKGEGDMVEQAAKATLWDITKSGDKEGHVLATKITKVTAECESLLGFTVGQFRQIVTLPQGKFRDFLDADSGEREKILEILFQTQRYSRIQEHFKVLHKDCLDDLKDFRSRTQVLLESVEEDSADTLELTLVSLKTEEEKLGQEVAVLKEKEDVARKAFEKVARENEKLAERKQAKEDLGELKARAAAIKEEKEVLKHARKAASLLDIEKVRDEAQGNLEKANRELDLAKSNRLETDKERKAVSDRFAKLKGEEPARKILEKQITRLDPVAAELKALEANRKLLAKNRSDHKNATGAAKKLISDRTRLANLIKKNEKALKKAEVEVAKIEGLDAKVEMASALVKRLQLLESLRKQVKEANRNSKGATADCNRAKKALDAAKKDLKHLQDERQRAKAAVLAEILEEGIPCPVCGSKEHPDPARITSAVPTEMEIEEAEIGVTDLEQKVEEARRISKDTDKTLVKAETALKGQEAEVGKDAASDPKIAKKALKAEKNALAKAKENRELAGELSETLDEQQGELKAAEERHKEMEPQRLKLQVEVTKLETKVEKGEGSLPHGIATKSDLDKKLNGIRKDLDARIKAWDSVQEEMKRADAAAVAGKTAAIESAKVLKKAAREEKKSVAAFDARLKKAGFEKEADYAAARLDEPEIEEVDAAIKEYTKHLDEATGRLKHLKESTKGMKLGNLELVEKAFKSAGAAREQKQEQRAETSGNCKRYGSILKQLKQLSKDNTEADKLSRQLGRISSVINGNNARRMTLQRYVLSTMLDSVLDLASARLRKMTDNRYELLLVQESGDGRRAGGLDLAVFDEWTGESRPVNTLSGGESFLTALALANGLSEAVQSLAGGIRLDTVFIDEGFGSLDSDSLDKALNSLLEIESSGRLIGIISHVNELKERISARLEVESSRNGSRARFIT